MPGCARSRSPTSCCSTWCWPDIDGFDVLARVRQHDAMKDVRIIMMTAKATREAVLKGLERGADGYVTKPFEVDVLLKAVKTVAGVK